MRMVRQFLPRVRPDIVQYTEKGLMEIFQEFDPKRKAPDGKEIRLLSYGACAG